MVIVVVVIVLGQHRNDSRFPILIRKRHVGRHLLLWTTNTGTGQGGITIPLSVPPPPNLQLQIKHSTYNILVVRHYIYTEDSLVITVCCRCNKFKYKNRIYNNKESSGYDNTKQDNRLEL